jgi:hypothetical protein
VQKRQEPVHYQLPSVHTRIGRVDASADELQHVLSARKPGLLGRCVAQEAAHCKHQVRCFLFSVTQRRKRPKRPEDHAKLISLPAITCSFTDQTVAQADWGEKEEPNDAGHEDAIRMAVVHKPIQKGRALLCERHV